jgi:adenylate cyclase
MTPGAGEHGAIVFTDIVGFTEFNAARGDAEAVALLDLQERLVRDALPERARIVKELGDGLLLWIPEANAALAACLEMLDHFAGASNDAAPLWVRMGMHWGCPTHRGDDLVGHDVNLAARIVDVAGPGELLASEDVRNALAGVVATGLSLEELGPVVMRGIPHPVGLYRVARETAASTAAAPSEAHLNPV